MILINLILINNDAFVSAAMADVCCMVHLVCLFMKMHLLALLQDNCIYLVRCAFLHKLSVCVGNITVFCQHLLNLIIADVDISAKPKYWPDISVYLCSKQLLFPTNVPAYSKILAAHKKACGTIHRMRTNAKAFCGVNYIYVFMLWGGYE